MQTADYDVKREAYWLLANAASGGQPQQVNSYCRSLIIICRQIQYLVECRILNVLCELLESDDESLVGVVLEAINAILRTGEELMNPTNPYVILMEEVC